MTSDSPVGFSVVLYNIIGITLATEENGAVQYYFLKTCGTEPSKRARALLARQRFFTTPLVYFTGCIVYTMLVILLMLNCYYVPEAQFMVV